METAQGRRLTPDELIGALAALGVRASRSTLARWVRQGLIPEPIRGSGGRAVGRYSLYPQEAVAEAVASANLLRDWRIPPGDVAAVRRIATTEYRLDEVLDHLGLGRPDSLPWPQLEVAWLNAAMAGDVLPGLPVELERMAGPPMKFRWGRPPSVHGEWTELAVDFWLRVRDLVAAGKPIPTYIKLTGWLWLDRTERGTYRFRAGE